MEAFGIVKQLRFNQITTNRTLRTNDVGQGTDGLGAVGNRISCAGDSINLGIDLTQGCSNRLELSDLRRSKALLDCYR